MIVDHPQTGPSYPPIIILLFAINCRTTRNQLISQSCLLRPTCQYLHHGQTNAFNSFSLCTPADLPNERKCAFAAPSDLYFCFRQHLGSVNPSNRAISPSFISPSMVLVQFTYLYPYPHPPGRYDRSSTYRTCSHANRAMALPTTGLSATVSPVATTWS